MKCNYTFDDGKDCLCSALAINCCQFGCFLRHRYEYDVCTPRSFIMHERYYTLKHTIFPLFGATLNSLSCHTLIPLITQTAISSLVLQLRESQLDGQFGRRGDREETYGM